MVVAISRTEELVRTMIGPNTCDHLDWKLSDLRIMRLIYTLVMFVLKLFMSSKAKSAKISTDFHLTTEF